MKIASFLGAAILAGAAGTAQAAPISQIDHLRGVSDQLGQVEKTQFFYSGRRYCFYPDGWRGPGFYWCGYRWRRGLGWGGPVGWRGWREPRGGVVIERRRGPRFDRDFDRRGGPAIRERGRNFDRDGASAPARNRGGPAAGAPAQNRPAPAGGDGGRGGGGRGGGDNGGGRGGGGGPATGFGGSSGAPQQR
jgi:hypothetical protein